MKILLDENCDGLREFLLEMGWDVVKVKEVLDRPAGANSVSDERILQYAREKKTIIVTKDRGLKMRCYRESVPVIGLGSSREQANLVDKKLKEMLAWKEYL